MLAVSRIKCYFCIMKNNHAPLVSFIITCYNLPTDMLAECIDSVLALPLQRGEREVILVDDGSETSPLAALGQRADEITYIRQVNMGLSEARNTGLRAARGEYIQFVDGDDRLVCKGYRQCLDIIRSDKPDMVMFRLTSADKEGKAASATPKPVSGTEYMLNNNLHATACGYAVRRETLGDLHFTPGILHEDEDFTPRLLLRADTVIATDITAYYYRTRPHSITTSTDQRTVTRRLDDIERIITHLDETANALKGEAKAAIERRVAQLTMDYIYNTARLTRSAGQLKQRLKRLEANGLFPLPKRNYTLKYTLFRLITSNKLMMKQVKSE